MNSVDTNGTERPQCVLCHMVMAEESMKPSIVTVHSSFSVEMLMEMPYEAFDEDT